METASGRFILPVCSWKNDEWKQHAIGTAIFTLHAQTASAISLRLGHDLPISVPFGKGQPYREFVTLEHVEIKKGAKEVRMHIIARDSGPLGIVKAGEISILGTAPFGVSSVRNDHATALPEQK